VHPDAARRGVGSRLLEEVVSWAREHGCRRVTLATFRDVAWNAPFYARHGFVEIVADTPFLEHVLEHERQLGIGRFGTRVLMARDLAGARRARFRPSTSGSETIMRTPRRRASSRRWAAALLWAAALTGTWMLLVAQSTLVNWVAAVGGGVVAALGARLLAARGHHAYTFRAGWLRWLPALTWQIVADFGIITAALGRAIATGRRTAGGGFVAREFDAGGDTARGRSWRAFVTLAATWSPNSYVVDIDRTAGHRINHDLVPHRASERPSCPGSGWRRRPCSLPRCCRAGGRHGAAATCPGSSRSSSPAFSPRSHWCACRWACSGRRTRTSRSSRRC
jgi:hypothetical protein